VGVVVDLRVERRALAGDEVDEKVSLDDPGELGLPQEFAVPNAMSSARRSRREGWERFSMSARKRSADPWQ
jgi:hypothetical protein